MILVRLVVENFRPYAGRTELSFAGTGSRNVTVIRGLNGTGKSSLFMALKWCFWGSAPVEQRKLVSTPAIKAAQPKSSIPTQVEVTYEHQGTTFKAIRSFRSHIGEGNPDTGEPTFNPEPTSNFALYRISPVTGEAKPVDTWFDELSHAVPREAVDYFFFDGEQIGRFADQASTAHVKDAIRKVLRFHELESAAKHVDLARQEYARRLKKVAGSDAADLIRRREELNDAIAAVRTELEDLAQRVDEARRIHNTYVSRLEELASIADLAQERASVVARLGASEVARDDSLVAMQSGLASLVFRVAQPALEQARTIVDAKRKRGEIPARVKSQVLRDWLEQEQCICGRELEPGGDARSIIESHLAHSIPTRTEDELTLLGGSIDLCLREGRKASDEARLNLARLGQARDMTQVLTDRLRKVEAELGEHPDEDVSKIAANANRARMDLEDLTAQKVTREGEQASKQAQVEQLSKQISGVEFHDREAKRLESRTDLAIRSANALRHLAATFEDDVRRRIETETSKLFPQLIWKDDFYSGVTLSEDFRLEALDYWGEPAFSTGGTSMGESRVLSLAFIVAMQVVARDAIDARAPAVADSPFASLSVEPIRRISSILPSLVDQVVLFLTEADWEWAQEPLKGSLGKEYEISFDVASKISSVSEVAIK